MSGRERVTFDEALLAVVRDEFDYPEQADPFSGQDRAALLAMTPERRLEFVRSLDAIRAGQGFEPLVLAAPRLDGPRVIVHGQSRATAFVRLCNSSREIAVFLGVGEVAARWPWWPSQAAT